MNMRGMEVKKRDVIKIHFCLGAPNKTAFFFPVYHHEKHRKECKTEETEESPILRRDVKGLGFSSLV